MKPSVGLLLLNLLAVIPAAAIAQMSPSSRAAVEAYRASLRALDALPPGRGLEVVFTALTSLSDALTHAPANQPTVLESLSDDEYRQLQRDLPGALINREETLYVTADPDFFVRRAATQGDSADRQFFGALKATRADGVWPVYVEQQTDYSGCTRFGSGALVDTYRLWSEFRNRFPRRYTTAARAEEAGVTMALTQSTCACGDAASFEQELRRFLEALPTSPINARIRERLKALREGRSDIRPSCNSG